MRWRRRGAGGPEIIGPVALARPATLSLTGEESATNQITKVPTRRHLLNKWIATKFNSIKTAFW